MRVAAVATRHRDRTELRSVASGVARASPWAAAGGSSTDHPLPSGDRSRRRGSALDPGRAPGRGLERVRPIHRLAPDPAVAKLHEVDAEVVAAVRVRDPPLRPPEAAAAPAHHTRVPGRRAP